MASLGESRVKAVFFGHNHRNSHCCMPLQGVSMPTLCYRRHMGYCGYGDWAKGALVVQLVLGKKGGDTIRTWLHMEDGRVRDYATIVPLG
jgi:hypothetical protein